MFGACERVLLRCNNDHLLINDREILHIIPILTTAKSDVQLSGFDLVRDR